MRVAVVDIGTNSTRLLIAEVDPRTRAVVDLYRTSTVTRLGDGVDGEGRLAEEAIDRVISTLSEYRGRIDEYECEANLAVLTSAVRDASNGASLTDLVRREFHLDAHTLSGGEEAKLTFIGAMFGRDQRSKGGPTVVVDIGGGSTEFIIGESPNSPPTFHTSLQVGVVRMSERHIHSDPPALSDLRDLALDTRTVFREGLPSDRRGPVTNAIAVAGTATSAAAIDQELDPYDPARVHGYVLRSASVDLLLARLADMDEDHRRQVVGLHPDRAPTIVAGLILLKEAMVAFELDQVEVSEHDILRGGVLRLAGGV